MISEEHFHSAFASSEPDYQLRAAVAPRVSCATAPSPRQPREPPAAVHAEIRPLVRLYRCGVGQCCGANVPPSAGRPRPSRGRPRRPSSAGGSGCGARRGRGGGPASGTVLYCTVPCCTVLYCTGSVRARRCTSRPAPPTRRYARTPPSRPPSPPGLPSWPGGPRQSSQREVLAGGISHCIIKLSIYLLGAM